MGDNSITFSNERTGDYKLHAARGVQDLSIPSSYRRRSSKLWNLTADQLVVQVAQLITNGPRD